MPTWAENIPQEHLGWRHIALSSKNLNGANVRFSPVVLLNNVAGAILHNSVNGSIGGMANEAYKYTDGVYTWLPIHILNNAQFDSEIQLWFAEEAYVVNWGAYVNTEPDDMVFIDLPFLGMPTLHLSRDNAAVFAEVFHALGNYITAKL